jgi:hypothetical protein
MLGFGVIPSYNFGAIRAYFNTGIHYKAYDQFVQVDKVVKDPDSSVLGWHANPYITLKKGPGTFYAALQLESEWILSKDFSKQKISWGIPVALQFEF